MSQVFTARDLRIRAGELLRQAEEGGLAIITKHGRPTILALPFDDRLLELGVHRQAAVKLFAEGMTTLAQSAKIAGCSIEELLVLLAEEGIPAVDYPPDELEGELETTP